MNKIGAALQRWYLVNIGKFLPSDLFARRYPVSIKGVCFIDNKVILLKNEREEWDLPGGKLKRQEKVEDCLKREFQEELSAMISIKRLLHVENVRILNYINVLVVIFHCETEAEFNDLKISHENFGLGLFSLQDIEQMNILGVYIHLIKKAFELQNIS